MGSPISPYPSNDFKANIPAQKVLGIKEVGTHLSHVMDVSKTYFQLYIMNVTKCVGVENMENTE